VTSTTVSQLALHTLYFTASLCPLSSSLLPASCFLSALNPPQAERRTEDRRGPEKAKKGETADGETALLAFLHRLNPPPPLVYALSLPLSRSASLSFCLPLVLPPLFTFLSIIYYYLHTLSHNTSRHSSSPNEGNSRQLLPWLTRRLTEAGSCLSWPAPDPQRQQLPRQNAGLPRSPRDQLPRVERHVPRPRLLGWTTLTPI
jgi:hypothetical protein